MGRIYIHRSGAVRFERYASLDATEPETYKIRSGRMRRGDDRRVRAGLDRARDDLRGSAVFLLAETCTRLESARVARGDRHRIDIVQPRASPASRPSRNARLTSTVPRRLRLPHGATWVDAGRAAASAGYARVQRSWVAYMRYSGAIAAARRRLTSFAKVASRVVSSGPTPTTGGCSSEILTVRHPPGLRTGRAQARPASNHSSGPNEPWSSSTWMAMGRASGPRHGFASSELEQCRVRSGPQMVVDLCSSHSRLSTTGLCRSRP